MYRIVARDAAGAEVGWVEVDEHTGSMIVGRSDTCHLWLNHPAVSEEHAYLYVQDGEVVVEDAGSAAGTELDGYPIGEPVFAPAGSLIRVGPYELEVIALEASGVAIDARFERDAAAAGIPAVLEADSAYAAGLGPRPGTLKLVGVSGLEAGQETPVVWEGDFDAGRDPELEVPVMDPTVSRRHARLRLTEEGMLVLDLRSTNGTYVNGERVKRKLLAIGDRVRFGEVAFEVQAATAADLSAREGAKKTPFSRKQLILAGGGAMIVLALVVVGLLSGGPPKGKQSTSARGKGHVSVDARLQRKFRTALAAARTEMGKRRWRKAKKILLDTKDIFAQQVTRDRLLIQVNEEMHAAEVLKRANALYDGATTLESYLKAKEQYELIKPTSDYATEARGKLEKVRVWLAKYYLTEGLTYAKARLTKNRIKAAHYLCKYFTFLPEYYRPEGNEEAHREKLKWLEKRIRRVRRRFETCKAPRYLHPPLAGSLSGGKDALAELRNRYSDEAIVQALLLYYNGKLDEAVGRIQKMRSNPRHRKQRMQLATLYNRLTAAKGQYSAGTGFIQSGKLMEAQAAFKKAIARDGEFMPPLLRSYVRRESSRLLADAYLKRGMAEFDRSRYQDAYRYWHKGKLASKNHVGLQNALLKLETVARKWLSQAKDLARAGKTAEARLRFGGVREITEPGSRFYLEATKALAKLRP